eukprot:scaffold119515_cov63-Phaeocystis_antarctica.AAC.3
MKRSGRWRGASPTPIGIGVGPTGGRRVGSDAAQMMKYVVCIASRGGGAVARQSIWKSHTSARKDRLSSSSSSAACTARGCRVRGCSARGVEE